MYIFFLWLDCRQPSLTVDSRNISHVPSFIDPIKGPITSSHIPVYQPLSHSVKQVNAKISNGFNTELQPNKSNPFQNSIINENESITSDRKQQQHLDETAIKTISPPIPISSSSYSQQFSPSLSRKSSMNERDVTTDSPLIIMPGSFVGSPLQSSIRNNDSFEPLLKSIATQHSKSSPSNEPPLVIPRTDEFTPRVAHLNYDYCQSETPIVTLEHQRIDHHRQTTSPQMLHFQQIEERMVDQLNELYKATMLIHSNQRETPQRLDRDEIQQINQTHLKHEPVVNQGNVFEVYKQVQSQSIFMVFQTFDKSVVGSLNYLHRNNSLSPFLQRKYSLQAHQQRLNESNIPRWRTPQYGRSISATASPNLDAHRRYQTAIPVLDTDKTQIVRLKGNTSPIGEKRSITSNFLHLLSLFYSPCFTASHSFTHIFYFSYSTPKILSSAESAS